MLLMFSIWPSHVLTQVVFRLYCVWPCELLTLGNTKINGFAIVYKEDILHDNKKKTTYKNTPKKKDRCCTSCFGKK